MVTRRGFIGSILALGVAPAIVRADSLMRIVSRDTAILLPSADIYPSNYGMARIDSIMIANADPSRAHKVAVKIVGADGITKSSVFLGMAIQAGSTLLFNAEMPMYLRANESLEIVTNSPQHIRHIIAVSREY